jgi:hypothetical protein
LAGLLLSSAATFAAAGWTNAATTTQINQQPATGVGAELVFVETNVSVNPSGCSHPNGFYFLVSDKRRERLFALLMVAQASSKTVQIYATAASSVPGRRFEGLLRSGMVEMKLDALAQRRFAAIEVAGDGAE